MRLGLDPRARRLLRRVPRTTVYSAMEIVLLSLLAMQCARLVWTIVTPVDPIGEWRASSAMRPVLPASTGSLASFDPFFRLSPAAATGPAVITSLNLQLFGVRGDLASGRGAAIISTPDGTQRNFLVGEEIVPGVTLTAVGFDNVTISRSGTTEQIFLDQSPPAATIGPNGVVTSPQPLAPSATLFSPPPPPPAPPPPAQAQPGGSLTSEVQFQPRLKGGQVSGVTVQPQGSGNAFRSAGLAPGDVITSVNGQSINSADQARAVAGRLGSAKEVTVQVERGGRTIPLRVRTGQ